MAANSPLQFSDETGSQVVEFGLVLLPLMAFVFLIMDVAWICFAQSSLQHAVQAGVRAAVTSYLPPGSSSQDAYIKSTVQQAAMGFLAGQSGLDEITITYYSPSSLKQVTGSGSNAGGNIIEVGVANVPVSTLGPIFNDGWSTFFLNANSSDVMEGSPTKGPPPR